MGLTSGMGGRKRSANEAVDRITIGLHNAPIRIQKLFGDICRARRGESGQLAILVWETSETKRRQKAEGRRQKAEGRNAYFLHVHLVSYYLLFYYILIVNYKVKIMLQAKLSSKFQLSLPKALRDELNLHAGQQFTLVARGNIIELIPMRSIKEARGLLSSSECKDSSEYRDRQDRVF